MIYEALEFMPLFLFDVARDCAMELYDKYLTIEGTGKQKKILFSGTLTKCGNAIQFTISDNDKPFTYEVLNSAQ